jgi:hypothetical protein
MNASILRKWLECGYLERQVFFDTLAGTPQGGIISPTLANIALDGLERRLREHFPRRGEGSTRGRAAQVHLIRYADDCVPRTHDLKSGECDAAREMRAGPSKPACRSRLQTTLSCMGQESVW